MKSYECETCLKIFNRKNNYTTHLNKKKPCKLKEINNDKEKIKYDNCKIECLILENEKLKLEIEKINEKINITTNNITNNITNNNNNNINIIQIVNHGDEDYKKINMNDILKNLPNLPPFTCISSMIYYIHCNDEFPEYQNIYVTDLSRGKMKMFSNSEWITIEMKPAIEKLYDKIIEYYDDASNEYEVIYGNFKKEVKKTYSCGVLYKDKFRKNGINNSADVLYDNREKIRTIKNKKIKAHTEIIINNL